MKGFRYFLTEIRIICEERCIKCSRICIHMQRFYHTSTENKLKKVNDF